jgi:RHS repeat-associated protein
MFSITKDSAPTQSLLVSGVTNRITTSGFTYDANGNMTANPQVPTMIYDTANRLIESYTGSYTSKYTYDHAHKRIYKHTGSASTAEFYFYGWNGELMGAYKKTNVTGWGWTSYAWEQEWTNVSFAGRQIQAQSKRVVTDRLGSVRWRYDGINPPATLAYYPYGEQMTSLGSNTHSENRFATYVLDHNTGLDYADQRYHTATYGRFLTPDPYQASAGPADPGSWNRYAYVEGDPVNKNDPSGLLTIILGGTQLMPWGRSNPEYGQPGDPFHAAVSAYFGEEAITIAWRGQVYERDAAADTLFNAIAGHNFQEGERLNIVAFSHGGNVVKGYTHMLGARTIDTLVNIGTAQRADYRIRHGSVRTYLNVYSKYDIVQRYAAGLSPYISAPSAIIGGQFGWIGALTGGLLGWIAGSAGRTDSCAVNIGIDWTPATGRVGHSELHTAAVWHAMESWLVRAGHGLHPGGSELLQWRTRRQSGLVW